MKVENGKCHFQLSIIQMAKHLHIVPFLKKWEGGLSKNPNDSASSYYCPTSYKGVFGYHTNKGITYKTWVSFFGRNNDDRFYAMSDEDWGVIFKAGYWDKVKGDEINSQALANVAVSWAWGTGVYGGTKLLQKAMEQPAVYCTGYFGDITLKRINELNETEWFDKLCDERAAYFRKIGKGSNSIFLQGWLNRLNAFRTQFKPH